MRLNRGLTAENPTTTPNPPRGACEVVGTVGRHGRLDHFQRLDRCVSDFGTPIPLAMRCLRCHTCPNDVTLENRG
jgi:hypothetical protein